jgi:D-alanyl-lipoteichoic acid acyltransferase DltB (MBOAT superfamily)
VVGYAIQIYCDFSGYTDVAIGSALLLGIRFPLNFNAPYKARNIQDFWRRWHISLSTWLRDYLYVPLGGNRKGPIRTYVNLMLTMLLGGLWHGANWTFVVWGGLHGAALALTRFVQRRFGPPRASLFRKTLGMLLTFHFVCACWIFFRSDTFARAESIWRQLATLSSYHPNLHPPVLLALGVGLATHLAPERAAEWVKQRFIDSSALIQAAVLFAAALCLRTMASAQAVPFVYFQF